jgi:hypothetical protein
VKLSYDLFNDYLNKKNKFLELEVRHLFDVLCIHGESLIDVSNLRNW